MPTKKIGDVPMRCRHSDHEPPHMYLLPPGIYEHTCAGCGKNTTFTVPDRPAREPVPCRRWRDPMRSGRWGITATPLRVRGGYMECL